MRSDGANLPPSPDHCRSRADHDLPGDHVANIRSSIATVDHAPEQFRGSQERPHDRVHRLHHDPDPGPTLASGPCLNGCCGKVPGNTAPRPIQSPPPDFIRISGSSRLRPTLPVRSQVSCRRRIPPGSRIDPCLPHFRADSASPTACVPGLAPPDALAPVRRVFGVVVHP